MSRIAPFQESPCVKTVGGFQELASTPFGGETNAICLPRTPRGDLGEVVKLLGPGEGIVTLEEDRLTGLPASAAGREAIEFLLEDLRRLKELGQDPAINCVYDSQRDENPGPIQTDVFSFHVDSAPIEAVTWLCTYFGAPSEGLCNGQAVRRVDQPDTRAELLQRFGGVDDAVFRGYLHEQHFDLHYAPGPGAQPFSFGVGNLWRLAVEWPGSPVSPSIHRAPAEIPGAPPRLLLIA